MIQGSIKNYFLSLIAFIAIMTCSVNAAPWCGNKYNNLVILKNILKNDPNAEVPPFLCISTDRVEKFLYTDIFKLYFVVTERLNPPKSFLKRPFIAFKNFIFGAPKLLSYESDSTEKLIETIQFKIKEAFRPSIFSSPFPFTEDELNFFKSIAQKNGFLMVRSTGVEDNPNVANAGGNVSVAYVTPSVNDIQRAMGEVVASYFGMQSLKNRIAGGEVLSPTYHTLPILIQELVGEPAGGAPNQNDIPVSGVAYTTNANLSSRNFAVTEINAAYGHGEGVVANKVVADRYFLTPSRAKPNTVSLYPMLYEKRERLIPSKTNNALVATRNSDQLAHKSALSEEQITQLYKVLKEIERSYRQPMDVEFIVMSKKIYIVQARPAMHKPATPSYFALDKITSADATPPIACVVLVPGTGALQIITDPKDVIVAKTLDEADQMPNSFSAKVVIVAAWASSLSHPAVNFMSHGTPCLYIQNVQEISKKLESISPSQPLIVDTQRGILFFWQNTSRAAKDFIVKGWFEHPIDRTLSLFMDNALVLEQFTQPLPKDPIIMNLGSQLKVATNAAQQKDLLNKINERVEKLINLTERRVKTTQYTLSPHAQQTFDLFKKTYRDLIAEFSTAIDRAADHFEFLFYHKMLEALLYQMQNTQRVLAGYTYSYFLNEIFEKQQGQRIIKAKNISHVKELNYASYCPSKELSQKWIDFITILDKITPQGSLEFKEKVIAFDAFLNDLSQSNNLPLWFATTFYQASNNNPVNEAFVEAFIKKSVGEYTAQTKQFLNDLITYQQTIANLTSHKGNGFASLSAARGKWQSIQVDLVSPMTSAQFITEFKHAPFVIQMIACTAMRQCIDVLDSTIKELKTSSDISIADRITMFKDMLNDFNTVFLKWVTEIMPEKALIYHPYWGLQRYLTKMEELYQRIIPTSNAIPMFQRSRDFAVNAAMLGSGTAFDRHYPDTAEDIFMLIHQNALVAVSGTVKSLFDSQPIIQLMYMPPFLEACREAVEATKKITLQPIGISYTADETMLSYNIPLNNHSGAFQFIYNSITQECLGAVQFLGEARGRWEQVAILARLSPELSGLKLTQDVLFDEKAGIVSWSWIIEKSDQLPLILDYLSIMGNQLSYSNDIELANLKSLYRGSSAQESSAIKRILQNYTNKFGAHGVVTRIANRLY
jgi:hypothetical protein